MTNPATEAPPKKKKHHHIATWIALASAVAAVISVFFVYKQVNAANQGNTVAEQQQLVTLTTTIVQQLNQLSASTSSGQIALSDELTLEGQSAETVITELHGIGVTGAEYEEVATALTNGEGYTTEALPYYQKAVNTPPYDVGTQASALRGEAALYYELGQPDTGHEYFMQAVNVFNGNVMAQYAKDNNIAQSYLADAEYDLNFTENHLNFNGCSMAATDIKNAENFLSRAGPGPNATNPEFVTNDQSAYSKDCLRGWTSATPAG